MSEHQEDYVEETRRRTDEQSREDQESYYDDSPERERLATRTKAMARAIPKNNDENVYDAVDLERAATLLAEEEGQESVPVIASWNGVVRKTLARAARALDGEHKPDGWEHDELAGMIYRILGAEEGGGRRCPPHGPWLQSAEYGYYECQACGFITDDNKPE